MIKKDSFFDLHVHVSPDLYERRYTALTLANELELCQSVAVIKSHSAVTTGIAKTIRELGFSIYGSITLNAYCGGLSIDVVKSAIAENGENMPMIIYFPTLTGKHGSGKIHQKKSHKIYEMADVDGISISENGCLLDIAKQIIHIAIAYNVPLATGHIEKKDIFLVVEEVRRCGGKIILTHPFHPFIGLSVQEIMTLMQYDGVYFEMTLLMFKLGYMTFAEFDHKVALMNHDRICISSDFGQTSQDSVIEGFEWLKGQMLEIYGNDQKANEKFNQWCLINPMRFMGVQDED